MMNSKIHIPVLLNETLTFLNIKSDGFYIDCTLGDGGHSSQIKKQLSDSGLLFSFDQDQESIKFVREFHSELIDQNWQIFNINFSKILSVVGEATDRRPDGILMDIGLSSRQLEAGHRGFSFQNPDEPLDMRMDSSLSVTAADLLKVLRKDELEQLFKRYGEERYSRRIAQSIKDSRDPINSVGDLNLLINRAVPAALHSSKEKAARRVFQALRIAVNDELGSLQKGLEDGFELLNSSGRMVVIAFHSLEDRIVKEFFKTKTAEDAGKVITEKPVSATDTELEENPRAKSAKLRCIEKL